MTEQSPTSTTQVATSMEQWQVATFCKYDRRVALALQIEQQQIMVELVDT